MPKQVVMAFAIQLRQLRESAGCPSYRQMARAAHFSPSTLAEAVQGRRLPSRSVVEGFAVACGADTQQWVERWQEAAKGLTQASSAVAPLGPVPATVERTSPEPALDATAATVEAASAEPVPPGRRWRVGRVLGRAGVTTAAVAVGFLGHLAWADAAGTDAAHGAPQHAASVTVGVPHDGADPADAGCGPDAGIVSSVPLMDGTTAVGVLELRYSVACRGGWMRFYLNQGMGPALVEGRLEASDGRLVAYAQTVTAGLPLYTDLLRPAGSCLRGLALVHLHGRLLTVVTECFSLAS